MKRLLCALSLTSLLAVAAHAQDAIIDAGDYPNLQAAADAIPASGGELRIPPGTYELTEPLRIHTGDTRIVGAGTASHLVNKNTDGQPAILIEHADYHDQAPPREERLWRICLADLRVTGNEQSGSGIDARYIQEIMIDGVSSSYHGGDGLHLVYCNEDPRICDNLFTYNKASGVHIYGCHDIIVAANHFEENQDGLRCIDAYNLTMNGNNLDDHLGDGVVIENTYGSVLAGNMIEECQGWGVVLDRDCYGITISANVIAHDFAGGIDLRDAHGCAVSANTFTIVKNIAVAVRPDSGSITLTGNNFSDTWIGDDADGQPQQRRGNEPSRIEENPNEAAGILLERCESVAITGNVFSRLSTEAVRQQGECVNIVQSGNVLRPRQQPEPAEQ
ncbi:right-handed parallel beta-helix repeat-containing protein [Roseimaritima sediminicola]|uniref:right-handed parallel beta-helix repeat-containing protein n=1 Tax=Roseimaritima sediminicola TaxID=2662066 RepID=UPI0012983D4C|nr:right-handed parallel beta-helix repeat-containing protein [Roseimaritima sediminicola]